MRRGRRDPGIFPGKTVFRRAGLRIGAGPLQVAREEVLKSAGPLRRIRRPGNFGKGKTPKDPGVQIVA
jgi:hypothetical protein